VAMEERLDQVEVSELTLNPYGLAGNEGINCIFALQSEANEDGAIK
jgi:hypothetical protein